MAVVVGAPAGETAWWSWYHGGEGATRKGDQVSTCCCFFVAFAFIFNVDFLIRL